jgi:dipeptidyl aminopeptidase/acylaminoacyl peptidase
MGEVYRARDTKLGRDVAIKILPQHLAGDPDRMERFEREARVLASLNHPHIASIYGFEDAAAGDGLRVSGLVLELVEGETLADRLSRGALPIPDALAIARQIAAALDAAHQRGIIHRDLKPANVKVTPEGVAKVLDFGLAKTMAPDLQDGAGHTTMELGTHVGIVLGTAPYMSPEQARGQSVDKRTDIWAFGCTLYEMLSGRRAFSGDTISDTIAAILEREVEWNALPPQTPPAVLRLMKRCLERDPQRRLRDLGDADLTADQPATPLVENDEGGWYPRWMFWTAAAVAALAGGVATFLALPRSGDVVMTPADPLRFQIPAPVTFTDPGNFSVSPDGRHVVFVGADDKGILRLRIRDFETGETRSLAGTEAEVVEFMPPMIWSPDSRVIAFYSQSTRDLKRIDRLGGLPRVICKIPGVGVGGSWNAVGVILIGNTAGGVVRCPAGGGVATAVTAVDPSLKDAHHLLPAFLPDNRHFVYLRVSRTDPSESGLYLADLEAPADRQSTERIVATPFGGAYMPGPNGNGHLLFVQENALMAMPFDAERRVPTGQPTKLASGVGTFRDSAFFSASRSILVYRESAPEFQMTWLDRDGSVKGLVGEAAELGGASLSPDEAQVVTWRRNRLGRSSRELWLIDVARNTSIPFATEPEADVPAWSVDGRVVYFALGTMDASLARRPADGSRPSETFLQGGTGSPRYTGGFAVAPTPDGRFLVLTVRSEATGIDLWLLPLTAGVEARPLVVEDFDQTSARVSPDGRWLAYVSRASGVYEVFVRPLTADPVSGVPVAGASRPVSRGGGISPRWRKDSRELFFQSLIGSVMSVPVEAASFGTPSELFRAPGIQPEWDVRADGQRFLVAAPVSNRGHELSVIVNWQSAIRH